MDQARQLWNWWLPLLRPCADSFTRPGWVLFVQWVTGIVLCWEEYPLTQVLMAIGLETRWRVLEHFAAYGAKAVERHLRRLIRPERPARWERSQTGALSDTTLHRTGKQVWGTWTCHEASARSPNRAETVRGHNGVARGGLWPGRPWTYRPHAGRLSGRQAQRPPGEPCRTETALAVACRRQAGAGSAAPLVGVFDGASAVDPVIRPCLEPRPGQRRLACVTRRRADARLYHPVGTRPQAKGRPPTWGPRIAAPQPHLSWPVSWQRSRAWGGGRLRACQDQPIPCRWAVRGAQMPVHVLVGPRAGHAEPWFLVTSALAQTATTGAARFRPEVGAAIINSAWGWESAELGEGTDPAHVPGLIGRAHLAPPAPRPCGAGLRPRQLVLETGGEPAAAPCAARRPPSPVLAVPARVFAVPRGPGRVGKDPAAPWPVRTSD